MLRAAILGALLAALSAATACTCNGTEWDDEDIDRTCDCSGMALAIFEDCHGVVEIDGEMPDAPRFAAACDEAIANETADMAAFECRIQASCDASDCEDFAKRLALCAY